MATSPSSTVVKAFDVLALFRTQSQLGVSECAEALDMPRPTAHRMLVSLVAAGAVERTGNGHYRLNIGLFEIGSQVPLHRHLFDRAHAVLEALVTHLGLSAHLAVRDGTELVYVIKCQRANDRMQTRVGQRNKLHATSLGKVLLAHAPVSVVSSVLAAGLPAYTPHTITTEKRLVMELEECRHRGYALDRQERIEGVVCIAVPVRDRRGSVVAAISIPANSGRIRNDIESLLPPLRAAAHKVERNIRQLPPSLFPPSCLDQRPPVESRMPAGHAPLAG